MAVERSVVLVTGMSGTGKSTVLAELHRRGNPVVDTDDGGWIVQARDTGAMEPLLDLERMGSLLDGHKVGSLFVAACVANQRALYHRFDAVVLLSAPVNVLMARVARRANPYGSTQQARDKIVDDLARYEPLLRAGADYEVVTTVPIIEVVNALERFAASATNERTSG